MREVYSSVVEAIDYRNGNLIVHWRKSTKAGHNISVYTGVPEDVANDVMNAASVGSALRDAVIGVYDHHYA